MICCTLRIILFNVGAYNRTLYSTWLRPLVLHGCCCSSFLFFTFCEWFVKSNQQREVKMMWEAATLQRMHVLKTCQDISIPHFMRNSARLCWFHTQPNHQNHSDNTNVSSGGNTNKQSQECRVASQKRKRKTSRCGLWPISGKWQSHPFGWWQTRGGAVPTASSWCEWEVFGGGVGGGASTFKQRAISCLACILSPISSGRVAAHGRRDARCPALNNWRNAASCA